MTSSTPKPTRPKPKIKRVPSIEWFQTQIKILRIGMAELEQRLYREQGPEAVRAYEEAVAAKLRADTGNVVRLSGRRK